MTDVTEENPTGITEFDVHMWASQPEWPQIAALVNTMIRRVARDEAVELPDEYHDRAQDYIADALSHLGRAIGFMDSCRECGRGERSDEPETWTDSMVPPYRVDIDGQSLQAVYRCAAGHEWDCGWSLLAPGLFD